MEEGRKGIGALLERLRTKQGCTMEQLGRGVCTPSQIEKIEKDEQSVDPFLIDRLFGRLGKSTERLEYVLPIEAYELYELRYLIQTNICRRQLGEAEELLKAYEKRKSANRPLHRQFIAQERVQIGWLTGQKKEEILVLLSQAMSETMQTVMGSDFEETLSHGRIDSKIKLSAEELKLILFRWEISRASVYERRAEEIWAVFSYLKRKEMDDSEFVKVFPYAVLLLGKSGCLEEQKDVLEKETKRALSILRDEGKIAYMPEILEQYSKLLEKQGADKAFLCMLRQERKSLLEVCGFYGIHLEKVSLFEHILRRFQLDYELIQKTRQERGISQEKLSDGICELPTISRIERGHRSPRDKNLCRILERLQKDRRRMDTIIETDSYEVIRLKKKYNRMLFRARTQEAIEVLQELERYLNPKHLRNQQFLKAEWAKVNYAAKKWDADKCLKELESALRMTMDVDGTRLGKHVISVEENSILNEMALIYRDSNEVEIVEKILKMIVNSFEESNVKKVFHIIDWGLVKGNLAILCEEQGKTELAIELSHDKNEVSLEAGKGNAIGSSMITIASSLEQQQDDSCVAYFQWGMDLLKLYKSNRRYEIMVEYVNRSEFQYHNQINHCHCGNHHHQLKN